MNIQQNLQEYLQSFGIKPSLQRIAIMNYLMKNRIHPTADEIYNALFPDLPTLSKTTVYNTLRLFVEQGALLSLGIDEKNVRFDVDTSCHAHFQCNKCGRVYDVPVENKELLQPRIFEELTISEIHLYYKGYCKACKNKKEVVYPLNNIN